jgi:hypothetical protein
MRFPFSRSTVRTFLSCHWVPRCPSGRTAGANGLTPGSTPSTVSTREYWAIRYAADPSTTARRRRDQHGLHVGTCNQ